MNKREFNKLIDPPKNNDVNKKTKLDNTNNHHPGGEVYKLLEARKAQLFEKVDNTISAIQSDLRELSRELTELNRAISLWKEASKTRASNQKALGKLANEYNLAVEKDDGSEERLFYSKSYKREYKLAYNGHRASYAQIRQYFVSYSRISSTIERYSGEINKNLNDTKKDIKNLIKNFGVSNEDQAIKKLESEIDYFTNDLEKINRAFDQLAISGTHMKNSASVMFNEQKIDFNARQAIEDWLDIER